MNDQSQSSKVSDSALCRRLADGIWHAVVLLQADGFEIDAVQLAAVLRFLASKIECLPEGVQKKFAIELRSQSSAFKLGRIKFSVSPPKAEVKKGLTSWTERVKVGR